MLNTLRKLSLYARAAAATGSINLTGLPLLPKTWQGDRAPYNRGAYNEFLLCLKSLGLPTETACVLDVGANHGDFARAASMSFPQAAVWLFEPLPGLADALAAQAARNVENHWHVQPFALGARSGRLPLQIDPGDDAIGSFVGFNEEYQQANPAAKPSETVEARVETLDGFCLSEKIDAIDLLKIDVEGFEFEVLAGGVSTLQFTRAVIVEVSLVRQAGERSAPLVEMLDLLTQAGFHIVDLLPSLFSNEEPWQPLEYNLLARRPAARGAGAP